MSNSLFTARHETLPPYCQIEKERIENLEDQMKDFGSIQKNLEDISAQLLQYNNNNINQFKEVKEEIINIRSENKIIIEKLATTTTRGSIVYSIVVFLLTAIIGGAITLVVKQFGI